MEMEVLRRHMANIASVTEEYLPFQKVLEVKPHDKFLEHIKELGHDSPYGKVWITGSGPLSYERTDETYCLFLYRQSPLPPWVEEFEVVVEGLKIEGINAALTRNLNWMGSVYGLVKMAEELGIEHNLDRFVRKYEDTLYAIRPMSWEDLDREEIEEAARLWSVIQKEVEKKLKEGVRKSLEKRLK